MTHKITELNRAIQKKAAELGLIFASGPGTEALPANSLYGPRVSRERTNGQDRAVYLFAVGEKPAAA
jgi:hypothetical protein